MKIIILAFLAVIVAAPLASAQAVKINIPLVLEGKMSSLDYDDSLGGTPMKLTAEFFDSGSVGYSARMRMDLSSSNYSFTAWSNEMPMHPGMRSSFDVYWFDPSFTGKIDGRLRFYYGNEIEEKQFNLSKGSQASPKDIFEISDFRTYDDHVKFSIESSQESEGVVVTANEYPSGWIFEQSTLQKLTPNDKVSIEVPYKPSLWIPTDLRISAFSKDGEYYSSSTFSMVKEQGAMKYIHYLSDWLRVAFDI